MKIAPPESPVDLYNEGFGQPDILDRIRVGQALSRLVDEIEDPLVIALDGRWGSGKSYFLKRWVGAHRVQNSGKANTVYFDAFAHDYMSDPLVSLIAAISERIPQADEKKLKRVRNAVFKLARPMAKIGLSIATLGATSALDDVGDIIAETMGAEAKSAVDEFWNREQDRQAAMGEFEAALQELLESSSMGEVGESTPLVVVIDELDRCRPDFALEVLEVIKHFFSMPGLHFVLGVNLLALEQSVAARYGAGTDSEAYLRKFIGLRLSLPSAVGNEYSSQQATIAYFLHLVSVMELPAHLASPVEEQLRVVSRANYVSIRDVGKIASSLALASATLREKTSWMTGWVNVFATLVVAKTVNPKFYSSFRDSTISSEQLLNYFGCSSEDLGSRLIDL